MGYLTGKITATTKFDAKTDLRSGFDRFSPENIAANRSIVAREPLTLSLSLRTIVPATSKTNERKAHSLDTGFRTPNASGFAGGVCVAVVPAPGVLMVRLEPESVLLKANVRKRSWLGGAW
jgi:hypothetical protein